jgi:hypothetical protein
MIERRLRLLKPTQYPGADDRGGRPSDTANFVLLRQEIKAAFGDYYGGFSYNSPTAPQSRKIADWLLQASPSHCQRLTGTYATLMSPAWSLMSTGSMS